MLQMLPIYLSMIETQEEKNKFENIYRKYKNLMLCRAYDVLKDSGLAEDATHNAFMMILKNLHKIGAVDSKESRGYVMVILENEAKKIYNKEHKIKVVKLTGNESEWTIDNIVESKENIETIKTGIEALSDIYRSVLILKYFNDLSDKEIALSLSIPVATVRKRIMRGRKILLSNLKGGEMNG